MYNFIYFYTECNLSKDSTTTDDSIDYASCTSKCLNDLGNIELCSCHQNNEIGKNVEKTPRVQQEIHVMHSICLHKLMFNSIASKQVIAGWHSKIPSPVADGGYKNY